MGLSAFNAMRARMKAEAEALEKAKAAESKPIVEPSIVKAAKENPAASIEEKETTDEEKPVEVDESDFKKENFSKKEESKKTDAEKLKKKKD